MKLRSDHPSREAIEQLLRGTASPQQTREVVRHLLAGCRRCADTVGEIRSGPASSPARGEGSYDAVFERLERKLVEGIERLPGQATAQDLYWELLEHEAVEGLHQIHSTRRFASLSLCELLLRKSRELAADEPEQARRAADLAAGMTEQLDLELYGAPVVQDTAAIAWAYMAGTSRVQADLRTIESSIHTAGRLLERGIRDPLARAELLTLQASLCAYGGRFEQALGLLNRAAAVYRRAGERHRLGRTLLKKGTVLGNAGRPDLAARLLGRSMGLIHAACEPHLMVYAIHNSIWFLNESGRSSDAAAWLQAARRLYTQAGDRRHLGRLRWLEGKLATRLDAAEGALCEAREGLAREGLSYEAALAAMDLAVLYAGENQRTAMRRQADQMLPLFRSEAMFRDTVVALLSFQQNAGRCKPAELIGDLAGYLDRTRQDMNPPALARRLAA
jgi:tetratricopeptide (TPR) repeat protein